MCRNIKCIFLAIFLLKLCNECYTQGLFYSSFSNPYQNSFALATPNLRQMFTTKLTNTPVTGVSAPTPGLAQINNPQFVTDAYQQNLQFTNTLSPTVFNYQPQQQYQQQLVQQQQQLLPQGLQFSDLFQNQLQQSEMLLASSPFDEEQLRQQLAFLKLRQQQLEQYQQQQVPLVANTRNSGAPILLEQQQKQQPQQQQQQQQKDNIKTENLLGVVYSPSNKVSQVKFTSAKLKYDF